MRSNLDHSPGRAPVSRLAALLAMLLVATVVAGAAALPSGAQDLQGKVSEKKEALDHAKEERGVLTSKITQFNKRIDQLTGQVAALRNREAAVQAELEEAEAALDEEQNRLQILRERLTRSVKDLQKRLVAIYKADEPSAINVVLESDGFEDVLERYEYLQRIQDQDADIVTRVRDLRDDTRSSVERIRANRDAIEAKKAELASTRAELERREAQLASARGQSERALGQVKGHIHRLEGDIGDLEDKIQAQLAAAATSAPASSGSSSGPAPLPAGPIRGGSGDMIWPVNGTFTSPFGPRWGRLHAGIDIAAPGGTPIRAAKAGRIVLAAPYGGYGNYTCIDHGGGLSTCYAHQSSFAITSGNVSQGDVIGYVGNTGASFGDHLHFEVRVNGTPVDPMGYL